jgi:hypothetical protein
MNIEDSPLFLGLIEHVTSISPNELLERLIKTKETYKGDGRGFPEFLMDRPLVTAFDWENTPYEFEFWRNLHREWHLNGGKDD